MISKVISIIRYHDCLKAIDWLCGAFGFEKHLVVPDDGNRMLHAQVIYGEGMIMVGESHGVTIESEKSEITSIYVVVDNADSHYKKSVESGVEIIRVVQDMVYGGREYSCKDLKVIYGVLAHIIRGNRSVDQMYH